MRVKLQNKFAISMRQIGASTLAAAIIFMPAAAKMEYQLKSADIIIVVFIIFIVLVIEVDIIFVIKQDERLWG